MHQIKIQLAPSEIKICEWLAKNRYQSNRQHSVVDKKIGPQSCDDTDLEGICGEFAFCKALNAYPDMSIDPRKGGFDLMIDGLKFDIKTTKYKTGKLLAVKSKKIIDCDYYALIVGYRPNYRMAGICKSADLIKDHNLVDLGYGLTYCMDQSELKDLTFIKAV